MKTTNIFRKQTCDICGAVEYKPYVGTKEFDGGYTAVNEFEPSEYGYVSMSSADDKGTSMTVCPQCYRAVIDNLKRLSISMKTEASV